MYDVIVIGGSYAGMAAALQLVRGRRSVVVIDAGERRNRFASTSHGLLGQDGKTPEEIASIAKAQLLEYPTLAWHEDTAVQAAKQEESFTVHTKAGQVLKGRRLILAMGVRDELPSVPGLMERWGRSVFHCPYCHGYELNQGPLGVLATGEASVHQALLIPDWGSTTFFTNDILKPDPIQQQQLKARGVVVEPEPVEKVSGEQATVELRDGRKVELAGLFVAPTITVTSPLAEQLRCEFSEGLQGPYISTNEMQETSVPGAFACGDAARPAGNLTFAIADGALAGFAAHRSLMFEGLAAA